MSKLNTVRKGDRAEYITQGIFSALGYSIQILRQEDYGIDFLCTITEKDIIVSYPAKSFTVQLKTNKKNIVYDIRNQKKVKWLLENNLPFFICYFDEKINRVDFYSTSILNEYIITKPKEVNKISFQFNNEPGSSTIDIKQHKKGNKIFKLNLGSPFLSISLNDLSGESIIEGKKPVLNKVVNIENENIVYRNLGLPFMRWLHAYETNVLQMGIGWSHFSENNVIKSSELLEKLGHILMSLCYSYKMENKSIEYDKLRYFILKLPFNKEYKSSLINMKFRDRDGIEIKS